MSLGEHNINLYKELKACLHYDQAIFEILFVHHSLKPVCRLLLYKEELNRMRRICRSYNFHYSIAHYKLADSDDIGRMGFQNTGMKVSLENPDGRFIVYFSLSEQDALKARDLEETDVAGFGAVLGYPGCCIRFFVDNMVEQAGKNMDFILPACRGIGVYPYVNNRCVRYFGITVLSHFPCDFNCEKSRKLGELYLSLIKKYDDVIAEKFERELKSFVLYTEDEGIYYSPDYSLESGIIRIGEVKGTVGDSKILNLLRENREIHYKTHKNFKIGRNIFMSGNEALMLFG